MTLQEQVDELRGALIDILPHLNQWGIPVS